MAIRYTYKVYEGFPEATEISNSRERNAIYLITMDIVWFIFSVIGLFLGAWSMIFLTLASGASIYYMLRYYPVVTEKKIKKAIEKRLIFLTEVKDAKYKCKYINILESSKVGTCQYCYAKNQDLKLCKVKNDIGTREIYLCKSCIDKYNENTINKQN